MKLEITAYITEDSDFAEWLQRHWYDCLAGITDASIYKQFEWAKIDVRGGWEKFELLMTIIDDEGEPHTAKSFDHETLTNDVLELHKRILDYLTPVTYAIDDYNQIANN